MLLAVLGMLKGYVDMDEGKGTCIVHKHEWGHVHGSLCRHVWERDITHGILFTAFILRQWLSRAKSCAFFVS